MADKNTDSLIQELMGPSSLDTYLKENCDQFIEPAVSELLSRLYATKAISKAALAKRSNISEVYLHQVFSGRRMPSRDRLLCICVGMEATTEETQRLLLQSGYGPLYPRNKRDTIIFHGLRHHVDLEQINEKLFEENEKTLF